MSYQYKLTFHDKDGGISSLNHLFISLLTKSCKQLYNDLKINLAGSPWQETLFNYRPGDGDELVEMSKTMPDIVICVDQLSYDPYEYILDGGDRCVIINGKVMWFEGEIKFVSTEIQDAVKEMGE